MDKIAQVVITRTINEKWKITAMSLKQTEACHTSANDSVALACIKSFMEQELWEQLSLDL